MTFLGPAACGGGGSSSTEILTEPVHHDERNNALAGADLGPSAIGYVLSSATTLGLGLSSDDDYRVVMETTTPGLRHVRLQQTYLSVPVYNSIVIAHADDSTFLGFNGTVTRNLDGFDVAPAIGEEDALAAAEADHAGGASVTFRDESSQLVILPGAGGRGARLAYLARFSNQASGPVPTSRMVYFIDAQGGAVIGKYDNLQAAVMQASGPGGNAKRSRTWSEELDVEMDGDEFVMDTERMASLDVSNSDMPFRGMDLANMEDPNGNDSQGHIEKTLDMMQYWMGRDSIDDNGFKITSYANDDDVCGWGPNNACWNGSVIQLGLGGGDFHNWAGALDAVGHEINHGFTEFHSGLTYAGQSGALNESFSDVAGTLAEFYDEGDAADFDLFEDIWTGEAFRFMCDPGKDGQSLDHAGDYDDAVDVHYTSGIPNRAFCLSVGRYRAATGASARAGAMAVGHIWYAANAAYWTSGTTFEQACRGTVDAARALGQSQDVVQGVADSWADVGAACESGTSVCDSDGTCDAADGETCASCGDDCGSCAQDCSFWKKAKCKIGIGDCSQCGDDSGCGDGICDGDETDSNCGQDCGCAALDCEQIAPYGCWCDDACEEFGDCCADREGLCM
ncbi:MAG TPA: M4 family metallopeptidase [Kofleriaceae bacterium]|nr:M4 family metallopeptidase [Kofleriaceae bacterium]